MMQSYIKATSYPQIRLANAHSKSGQWANKLFDVFIAPLLRLRTFQMAYCRAMADPRAIDPWTKLLQQMNTTLSISSADLARIPSTGSLLVVANHPHGIMDGLLVGSLMHRVRDDFKIVINEATTMPGLEKELLFVSIFGSIKENAKKNMQVMREALEWLKAGHAVMVFPAGEISAIQHWQDSIAVDNTWSTNIIRLSLRAQAPILPLFIAGQNDALFLKLGLIHPVFRTLQIGRVTNQLRNKTLTVRASQLIPSKVLQSFEDDTAKTDFIRSKVYSLLFRDASKRRVFHATQAEVSKTDVTPVQIQAAFEILNTQPSFKILENNTYSVFLFNQQQLQELDPQYVNIFQLLKDEIGRLRELTFREIEEGSGQLRDIDHFDDYYYHLTLWDREQKCLIGAYRVCFTDEILPQYGIKGLYTALQFNYHPAFFEAVGPAMEVSRAFIVKEHQKNNMGLSTLLRALSQVLVRSPKVKSIFGAVSISDAFQCVSKKLILDFLVQYYGRAELSSWVMSKNPPRLPLQMPSVEWQRLLNTVNDLSLLNSVVSGVEADGKTIPPLISAYISMLGRFVAFDHDTGFNSIDGLLVVDLQESVRQNTVMMKRVMSKQSFEIYYSQLQSEQIY